MRCFFFSLAATFLCSINIYAETIVLNQPRIYIGNLEHENLYFKSVQIERTKETPREVTLLFTHALPN